MRQQHTFLREDSLALHDYHSIMAHACCVRLQMAVAGVTVGPFAVAKVVTAGMSMRLVRVLGSLQCAGCQLIAPNRRAWGDSGFARVPKTNVGRNMVIFWGD